MTVVLILAAMAVLEFVDTAVDQRRLALGPARRAAKPAAPRAATPEPAHPAEPMVLPKAA
ncbi:hypothetical protein C3942_20225 [Solimonas fluminis]|uniref:Uncharacterized protein n=2 Tax=Solimonas fluminis TaxID=2086571 RepID=A0A2S5TAZ3_9GAMM|nr:hypothetical protein C3942_20225 [Solimonas fluminis]